MGKAAKRKRNKKKRLVKAAASSKTSLHGLDYGVPNNAMAIGSFEFNNNLLKARVNALSYGVSWSDELQQDIFFLALVGEKGKYLKRAFDEFQNWASYSDGDAIDITFLFLKEAGYKLIIGPDVKSLIERTLQHEDLMHPLSFQVSWIKPFDKVSQHLQDFRKYTQYSLHPFYFSAAEFTGSYSSSSPPAGLAPIGGVTPILKFKANFIDEGTEEAEPWSRICNPETAPERKGRPDAKEPRFTSEQILSFRDKTLAKIFPVTTWRLENNNEYIEVCQKAKAAGLSRWQLKQAFCNALVSREISSGKMHFEGISRKKWPSLIIEKLRGRFEVADGACSVEPPITSDELIKQSMLDAGELLSYFECKKDEIPSMFQDMQSKLSQMGLLDK